MPQPRSSPEAQLGLPEYRGHSPAEKIAFAALVSFIVAALLGLFGDGPLSDTKASSADGRIQVQYQRFCRRLAPQSLDITLATPPGSEAIELNIDGDYLRSVQITEVFPEPVTAMHQHTGRMRFRTDGSGRDMIVRVHLKPQRAGLLAARLSTGPPSQASTVELKQLAYP
jgi:hypothetical protein